MRWLSLGLVVALAACDSQAPPEPAPTAPALTASVKAAGHAPFAVTEAVSVGAAGETVVLTIEGETFALSAVDAYRLGEALGRAGHASLDPERMALVGPGDGPRCEPPPEGSLAHLVGGRLYALGGGDRCPPPPPPPFSELALAEFFYGEAADLVTVEGGLDWMETPAGFVAPY